MDRTTNIIDDAEVARAMAMFSQSNKQARNKKKATGGGASSFKAPKAPSGIPTANARAGAATTRIVNRTQRGSFYEANGLKIPLYDNNGQGKKKHYARLVRSLLNKSTGNLLNIVEQYAGADKKQELMNKGLSKLEIATWIEEKETLALGRNPKSTLPNTKQDRTRGATHSANPIPPNLTQQVMTPMVPTPTTNITGNESQTAVEDDGTREPSDRRKRGAPDESTGGQPPQKYQKREQQAKMGTINAGQLTKETLVDNLGSEAIRQARTHIYNVTELDLHQRGVFMERIGLDIDDPSRSSVILRGESEDHVITATSTSLNDPVYLFETTITRDVRDTPTPPGIPFLKPGKHGRHGDFTDDLDGRTGHGHLIKPDDSTTWERYKEFQRRSGPYRPNTPKPGEGVAINPRSKETWDSWQSWYDGFLEKYPGYAVAHLWPCGCEVMGDGTESEEE